MGATLDIETTANGQEEQSLEPSRKVAVNPTGQSSQNASSQNFSEQHVDEPVVLRIDQDGVTTLTLNRPQQFNALSEAVLAALQRGLDDIAADGSIRVVVLAAKGKAFCAGHDLKEMRSNPAKEYYDQLFDQCSRMMMSINRLPQPVIAKVQGLATAAGCQLVAACDLAVAVDTAQFATSGIRYGLFCSTPAVPVSRNLSRKRAMELLLTGDFIDAQTAVEQGLINRAVPAADLDEAVQKLIDAIVAKSSVAVAMGKEMFYRQLEMGMEDAYAYASEVMACNMMAEDAAEGFDAFIEKRQPVWKGK
ncbi:enoyl-CoA hydratase [Chloroflexi bacterium TSY]|nr:enoyl-CoA hydratase [Chloroflexi bacterium TSY]